VVERLIDYNVIVVFVVVFVIDNSVKTCLVKGDIARTNNLATRRDVDVEDVVSASLVANELADIVARCGLVATSF
jgi:hypothetical protein